MNRNQAELKLNEVFGFERFHDNQWQTIDLLLKGKRVLLIEKTGFGKSLCYQFPAVNFDGITVVFSPLIALMRDQVRSLQEMGIPAQCINSEQTDDENTAIINDAIDGKIKILFIAPERQENEAWTSATTKMNLSMVVIDEAHTISVWGHDFRPAFRRIVNLVNLLPNNVPVLATTATATQRVQRDIEAQISNDIVTIRGDLMRNNFELYVILVDNEDQKLLWLGEHLNSLDGSGIIYTGTRVNTEIYSRWLKYNGIHTTEYNAGLDSETRQEVERGLLLNRWKAVISTNALGMGIDKPDLRFIVHTQIPSSPIHYYQEIGRAGRDGQPTKLILFYNHNKDDSGIEEDTKIPRAFINSGRPSIKNYQNVIQALKINQLGERQIMKTTNLKQSQVRVIKADLLEQGIIKEIKIGRTKKYEYQYNAPELNTNFFDELREIKINELEAMVNYIYTKESRMKFLCGYLGDNTDGLSANCDNTTLKPLVINPNEAIKAKLNEFRETYFPELIVESRGSNIVNGVAASYYGVSTVGSAIHRSKYENGGDFPDFLLKLTLKAYRKKFNQESFDLLLYVPPTESGDLVKNFATKLSRVLGIPISHSLQKSSDTKPQKVFKNSYLKQDNVSEKFSYAEPKLIEGKNIILFDDIFDSGATVKEVGKILTRLGAQKIAPIVIAKTIGGDF